MVNVFSSNSFFVLLGLSQEMGGHNIGIGGG